MRLPRVTKKNPCKICGKPDFCGFAVNDEHQPVFAICMRVASLKQAKNGGYIHILDDSPRPTKPSVALKKSVLAADPSAASRTIEEIDKTYRAFLCELVLSFDHENELARRGLNEVARYNGGYRSMPSKIYATAVCKRLIKQGFDLRGIPGFYTDKQNNFHFVDYSSATGFIIPLKNELGQIRALQLRRDEALDPKYLLISSANYKDGTSCGAPFHVNRIYPHKNKLFTSVIITEGVLKANVIAEITHSPVVGLIACTTFDESFAPQLQKVFPDLKECRIVFDMDFDTNKYVKAQRKRLADFLSAAGLTVKLLTWNKEFKGLDDYLLSTRSGLRRAA